MTLSSNDYLWDADGEPDAEIVAFERALKPLRAAGERLVERGPPQIVRRKRSGLAALLGVAAVLVLSVAALHAYRLYWTQGSSWRATVTTGGADVRVASVEVGEEFSTSAAQEATVQVARIGKIEVAPSSTLKLVRTESSRHRIELRSGRIRARIWAPPGYFGVTHADASVVDLGCEFDLSVDPSGIGALSVRSGWVAYLVHDTEVLVPASHTVAFSPTSIATPVREASSPQFRQLVAALDERLWSQTELGELPVDVANAASDEDRFTLLSLLTRYPQLARTALYPRLAAALRTPIDEQQRVRWNKGDQQAMRAWWSKIPQPPKRWWLHWRDAF